MLINNNVLENMDWNNHKEFDLRNVSKDVFVTGEIIDSKDLRNNKFKYVIELGHTSSEKPLFKWMKNEILNRWKNLQVDITDNSIDYFGRDKLFG
jgi:putative NIF3 family GTP cyclohydrolase 1 type 2